MDASLASTIARLRKIADEWRTVAGVTSFQPDRDRCLAQAEALEREAADLESGTMPLRA